MIYLDNAATSYPKPPQVARAMAHALETGANPGRAGHALALSAARIVEGCREAAAQMLREADADYDKKSDIKWNFTKFLVDRDGNVVARFEPTTDMSVVEQAVEKLL